MWYGKPEKETNNLIFTRVTPKFGTSRTIYRIFTFVVSSASHPQNILYLHKNMSTRGVINLKMKRTSSLKCRMGGTRKK